MNLRFFGFVFLGIASGGTALAQAIEPISIPLKHVPDKDNASDFNALGIMIAVNDSKPKLYQFDTGSDWFLAQIDIGVAGVEPFPGKKPELYSYGDGTYGYWMQKVQFGHLSYYDPENPSHPVATLSGRYAAGQILDWVFSKNHYGFEDHKMSDRPVGYDDGTPLYAEMDVRRRIRNGGPSDHPPFAGTFGAGNFVETEGAAAALGSQTKTGYVISANANIGDTVTPGCAPCLTLNLTPSVRSQFTALMPWGRLEYGDYQRQFDQSRANASTMHEGNYNYTISVKVGKKKRAVDFKGPILFDTGTTEFIYIGEDNVLKKLRARGFKLDEYNDGSADFKLFGFADKLDEVEHDDVTIYRQADEDEGNGLTIGIPFFQSNSLMYDLENKTTAYSPYFVTAEDFTTDAADKSGKNLSRVDSGMGSSGWLGLAGNLSGGGSFAVLKGANVRMTAPNSYTGSTYIAAESFLHLAGPGSIEHSSRITVDGALYADEKGAYSTIWGVSPSLKDVIFRDLDGKGDIYLGSGNLVLTAAKGRFDGSIVDIDDAGRSLGGGLVVAGGKLTIGGDTDYSGLTEVAAGAELRVTGTLTGDVSVFGKLTLDGKVQGTVTVNNGGTVIGGGELGAVKIQPGGYAAQMKTIAVD